MQLKFNNSEGMVDRIQTGPISIEREWFIYSKQGNIKDEYYFEKKLGSGGYGAVYLAKHKKTGKSFSPGAWRVISRQYLFLETTANSL